MVKYFVQNRTETVRYRTLIRQEGTNIYREKHFCTLSKVSQKFPWILSKLSISLLVSSDAESG